MAQTVAVWSLFIRFFHWGLVALFVLAYYTSSSGDDDIHMIAGYGVSLLLVLRLMYGFTSKGYAKFSSFVYTPMKVLTHLKQIAQNRSDHYTGHSPAGSAMVFTLLLLLLVLTVSGLVLQGYFEYEGPLWNLGWMPSSVVAHGAEWVHKRLPDILIGFIILHVLGVLLASVQHKENLVRAMITGRKISYKEREE